MGGESAGVKTGVSVPEVSYDRRTIRLHWATAVLVTALWGIAQIIDLFPKGAPKISARSVHIIIGVLLGVVLVIRIVWRSRSGHRLPPAKAALRDISPGPCTWCYMRGLPR